ncbi:hypothetical protein BGW38_005304, partial [Lunasporangiospora selenospora]
TALYYQVVQCYSPHIIAEQLFGHTHYDEFALYYHSNVKNTDSAVLTTLIGPSITPYTDLNPGSWSVFDPETYVADMSKAAT